MSEGPSRLLLGLFGATLLCGVPTLASGLQRIRIGLAETGGTTFDEAAASLSAPWFHRDVRDMARRLRAIVPRDEPILVTPTIATSQSGFGRFFLFLANDVYPWKVVVREPRLASGTLVEYPGWARYHFELLDTDGGGLSPAGEKLRAREVAAVAAELAARGVRWELTFRMDQQAPFRGAVLTRDGEPVPLFDDAWIAELEAAGGEGGAP